ncbi:STAS domain-containing protein [Georgenia sp. H159]|uniref:STAS domain-containing protein n=1 Tax=Georgenia sp. H159 TaxID=3076115 RepID=UPI002D769D18|nr:STAS domain-containing protein [Georgenia sp. H159]
MRDDRSTPTGKGHDAGTASVMVAQGRTRLVLSGEIDVALSSELTEAVAEAEASRNPVEIDARHVTFMDSSGVALLARLAHRTPGPLTMIKPPDVVRFLLDITRLGDVVSIVDEDPGFPEPTDGDDDDAA